MVIFNSYVQLLEGTFFFCGAHWRLRLRRITIWKSPRMIQCLIVARKRNPAGPNVRLGTYQRCKGGIKDMISKIWCVQVQLAGSRLDLINHPETFASRSGPKDPGVGLVSLNLFTFVRVFLLSNMGKFLIEWQILQAMTCHYNTAEYSANIENI